MDTKIINDFVNQVINSQEFKEYQYKVIDTIFKDLSQFDFDNNDDLRLLMIRIKDTFVAGLNYETSKHVLRYMKTDK